MNMSKKMPLQKLLPGFKYHAEILDRDGNVMGPPDITCNIFPKESWEYVVACFMGDTGTVPTPSSDWYLGLLQTGAAPDLNSTLADIAANFEETTYDEANRQDFVWTYDADTGVIGTATTNDRAEFTFTDGATIYGAFICNIQAKATSGSGIILSIAEFTSPRVVSAGGVLRLGAYMSLASSDA